MKNEFTIVQENGKFWLARNGKKFHSRAVCCLLPYDKYCLKGTKYDVQKKYNNDIEVWAKATWDQISEIGFTTVGAWSDDAIYSLGKPHTRVAWLAKEGGAERLMDVFSKKYADELFQDAIENILPYKGEPGLIGWFANNELPWYGEHGWPTDPTRTLFDRYIALGENQAGKKAILEFVKDFYSNSIEEFLEDWETEKKSFEELKKPVKLTPKNLNAKLLKNKWTGVVAEKYFSLAKKAIEENDPGTMFLGIRFAGNTPRAVFEVCAKYVDIISLNYYRKDADVDTKFIDNVYYITKKPIMITEFSFRAMENNSGDCNSKGADVTVQTQADRAAAYVKYCKTMAQLPYVIGWDWFQYYDQPPGGRFDGENSNYGVVSIDGTLYKELSESMKSLNEKADKIHAESSFLLPKKFDENGWYEQRPVKIRKENTNNFTDIIWQEFLPDKIDKIECSHDSVNDASIDFSVQNKELEINYDTGKGWGCTVDLLPDLPNLKSDGSTNILGSNRLILTANIPENTGFTIQIKESGSGELGEQYYLGVDGADGETFNSLEARGIGKTQEYIFPFSLFQLCDSHGNQRGNSIIDLQSIKSFTLHLPGEQGSGIIKIEELKVS